MSVRVAAHITVRHHFQHFAWLKPQAVPSKILNIVLPVCSRADVLKDMNLIIFNFFLLYAGHLIFCATMTTKMLEMNGFEAHVCFEFERLLK